MSLETNDERRARHAQLLSLAPSPVRPALQDLLWRTEAPEVNLEQALSDMQGRSGTPHFLNEGFWPILLAFYFVQLHSLLAQPASPTSIAGNLASPVVSQAYLHARAVMRELRNILTFQVPLSAMNRALDPATETAIRALVFDDEYPLSGPWRSFLRQCLSRRFSAAQARRTRQQ